jgi:hypothetical protein
MSRQAIAKNWCPLPLAKWYKPRVNEAAEEQRKLAFEASIPVLDSQLAAQPLEKMVTFRGVPIDRFSAPALMRIVVSVIEELEQERKMHADTLGLMRTLSRHAFAG